MTPRLLKKISELVEAGASIIGMAPRTSPSLSSYPQCDASVKMLAASLWGEGPQHPLRNLGKGTVSFDDSAARLRAQNPLAAAHWIWNSNQEKASQDRVYFSHAFDLESPKSIRPVSSRLAKSRMASAPCPKMSPPSPRFNFVFNFV